MNAKDLRIVFMGTPRIAAFILKALHREGYHLAGVVTTPDKAAGRGLKLLHSEVKQAALELGVAVLQPENLKAPAFHEALLALKPDVQVVVAFRMLPESVWALPPLGTFNMHASLLPQYRGAAPINRAIINGEKETGVTTFLLDHEIDTGRILLREKMPILEYETAGHLHDRMMEAGAAIVIKTLDSLAGGAVQALDQGEYISGSGSLKKAPKIYREDCLIDWKRPCREVVNLIHGLSPYPGAFTPLTLGGSETSMKIFEARPRVAEHRIPAGTPCSDGKEEFLFTTPDGVVLVKSLQMPGKKRMSTPDFLRGFRGKPLPNFP